MKKALLTHLAFSLCLSLLYATDYYIHPSGGDDQNRGTSAEQPWQTANPLQEVTWQAGDRLLIHAGDTLRQSLHFRQVQGKEGMPNVFKEN